MTSCNSNPDPSESPGAAEAMAAARQRMVERQLAGRDIDDRRVLDAMRVVPRHELVPPAVREHAYEDRALGIGHAATISQPYIVAAMTQAARIEPGARVLEVGTGSGYQAAVLAEMGAQVFSIELVPELAERARRDLVRLGYDAVQVRAGDGYRGWPEEAPFDAVLVTAAPDHVPPALKEQLRLGGRLVIPVGALEQELLVLTRTEEGYDRRELIPVRFVPMRGEAEER